ncbi:endo-1,4-beta-xylanase [Luteolibacter sp. LG18]|uniref:endo-1,4-beta-xylanase n=1 Tax=Luteolibacter sp. LG18 TaxID=2819286 RepID=UPI002B300A27|nr:beta-xylanase [Luteolibacter sp. LG18]
MRIHVVMMAAAGLGLSAMPALAQATLKDAFKNRLLVGVAVRPHQFTGANATQAALIANQFNSITPENVMKWDALQPRENEFHFEQADRYVDFGTRNGMFTIGHTLVWHSQVPGWLFKDAAGNPVDRETLLARMKKHIQTVVGRYKGRVKGWDVVNEALEEDGTLRQSPWLKIIGEDYLAKAFQFAHEADPAAQLYYNDYGIEGGKKRDGAIALLKKLKAAGVPVTGVGIQDHVSLTWPPATMLDETITAFGQAGLKVMITELDVDVLPARGHNTSADVSRNEAADPALNPYTNGLPANVQEALARRYAELFAVYLKHPGVVTRVTLWGLCDGESWLNDWPIRGRTSHPLLFDRACKPKPAFQALVAPRR